MAFTFWKFRYNPPDTVTAPVLDAVLSTSSTLTSVARSRASALIGRLDELLEANTYLQQVVLARAKGVGIELDAAVDVDVARAMEVVYSVAEAPTFITVDVYNRLLDAEMASLQLDMALPLTSPYEVNAFQTAAVSQVTKFVEDTLLSTGEFRHQVPLLLRNLKGDAVIFDLTKRELAKYPATQTCADANQAVARTPGTAVPRTGEVSAPISARNLDISEPLAACLNGAVDAFAGTYASMYQLAADVGHVERDVEAVLNTYVMQPMADVIRMVSLFTAMKGLLHVPRLKEIKQGLTGFVFVRLQSEATSLRCTLDRFMSLAVTPLKSMMGSAGDMVGMVQAAAAQADHLFGAVKGMKDSFTHTDGALKGMSGAYDCGMAHRASASKPTNPVQDALGPALTSLASHVQWGLDTLDAKTAMVDEAFQKVIQRRLADHGNQLDVMCSTQALDSLLSFARAVISVQQQYTGTPSSGPTQLVEAAGRILGSLDGGGGTRFTTQDGTIQVLSPDVPAMPAHVETVLRAGGLPRVVS